MSGDVISLHFLQVVFHFLFWIKASPWQNVLWIRGILSSCSSCPAWIENDSFEDRRYVTFCKKKNRVPVNSKLTWDIGWDIITRAQSPRTLKNLLFACQGIRTL